MTDVTEIRRDKAKRTKYRGQVTLNTFVLSANASFKNVVIYTVSQLVFAIKVILQNDVF